MRTLIGEAQKELQTSNTETANQTIKIIRRMNEHMRNDNCSCCKKILRDIFLIENNNAGSIGGKTTELGRTADTNR